MDSDLTPGLVFALAFLVLALFPAFYFIWRLARQAQENALQAQRALLALSRHGAAAAHLMQGEPPEPRARQIPNIRHQAAT
jgi:hypothetical protein